MKRFLSLFLTVLIIVGTFANTNFSNIALAVETGIIASGDCGFYGDNVTWELDSDGRLAIFGIGNMQNYTWTNSVPTTPWYQYKDSIDEVVVSDGVTSIGNSAFYGLRKISSVIISNDVIVFGKYAFEGCFNIVEINFPKNLQYIGDYCFQCCFDLINITMPDTVTNIGNGIFYACTALENVDLSANLSILPSSTFDGCDSLINIEVPEGITEIGSYCFDDCSQLQSVVLPTTLTVIGSCAFRNCLVLEQLEIPGNVTTIESKAFYNCAKLSSLKIPLGITVIETSLCYGCTSLTKVEIPLSVREIRNSAFSNCIKLNNIILHNNLEKIGTKVFYGCVNLTDIFIPQNIKSLGESFFGFYTDVYDSVSLIPNVKLYCYSDSVGETYAKENNINYSLIDISISSLDCKYTGEPVVPNINIVIDGIELVQNKDYEVEFYNNIDIGTATAVVSFINDYYPTKNVFIKDFQIGNLISECNIELDRYECQYHTATPNVSITYCGTTLIINQDYEVYYSLAGETWKKIGTDYYRCLWEVGECSVRIVGINEYIGEKIFIVPVDKFDMANAELWTNWSSNTSSTYDMKDFEYDGTAKKQSGFRVCDDNDTIPTDCYDVFYRNNVNVGTATMMISGKGDYYTGTLEKQFEIYPRPISSIEVTKMPNKIVYNNGESKIDLTGGQITVYYQDGGRETVNMKSSMLNGDYNLSMVGTQNIWLTYKDYSMYFEITVIPQLKCATPKLTKAANTASGVKVTWAAVEGADSYRVYRRAGGVLTWSYIGTTTTNTFTDAKATNNKYWIYTVIAVNEAGYSGFDKVGKTIKCVTAPKVTGVSNAANGLYVKWNAVPGAKEYRVYRKGLNYNSWLYLGTTKNTWFIDSPIKNSNGYYYKYTVIAVNDYCSGFYEDCAFTKRLSNPVLKSAVSSKTGITVKWNSVYGSTGYYVYRKTANSGWTLVGSTKGANNATYIDKTAKKGVTYTYTVRAYHGKTFSSYNSGISCKDKY